MPTAPDYTISAKIPAPPDYPTQPVADSYANRPFNAHFEARRQAFLEHVLRNPAPARVNAAYYEIARLAAGGTPHAGTLRSTLDFIDGRNDCADFALHGILRMLYQFGDHPKLSQGLLERARRTVLNFKYWPDEAGTESMCTWTENHQILFAAGAYLAGQLYPDDVFINSGQTGRQKIAINRPRIQRWLDLRFRTGFSEWLSHVYYDQDLTALLSLVDFCQDAEIGRRAAMVVDLLLFDMAVNSFQGVFGSTHGRSYENAKKWAAKEGTTDTYKLVFGRGVFSACENMSGVAFALSSRYRAPRAIYEVANDLEERPDTVHRQRMGIRLDEAERWGLSFDDFEDGMVFLSLEAYAHPRTISLVMDMFDAFNWWENYFLSPFKTYRGLLVALRRLGLLSLVARVFERDLCRNTREQVNVTTYRTPDYMLSSAQDYRKGYGGDQQHIWQATLGPNAVCFTTHPARRDGPSPNYWTGSGSLPRVAQVENVVIAVYNVSTGLALYVPNRLPFTHAWLPRDRFDEVIEPGEGGWVFARLGEGYLALRSQHPYRWQTEPGEDRRREVIVPGKQNVWICELGRHAVDGEFGDFIERVSQAQLSFGPLRVSYHSPSQGRLDFGWDGPLRRNGQVVLLGDYPRYANPYTQVDFPAEGIMLRHGEHWLRLNWRTAERQASSFI